MIIKDGKHIRYVLTKIEKNEKLFYFTVGEEGDIYFYTHVQLGDYEEQGNFIYNFKEENLVTEIAYLKEDECYKIWYEDFTTTEEEEVYKVMKEDIKELFLNKLKKKMKIDLYKFYIENSKTAKWENNFENKIFEIDKDTFYIDDDEFEIFYNVTGEGNYKFKFLDK